MAKQCNIVRHQMARHIPPIQHLRVKYRRCGHAGRGGCVPRQRMIL